MSAAEIMMTGEVSRQLPQSVPDTQPERARLARYREQMVVPTHVSRHPLADEGSYYVATNPTPGTSLLYQLQTSFSDTVPFLYLHNGDSPSNLGNKRLHLDYVRIIVTTAPASTTQAYFALVLDNVARALGTDNTLALTPKSPNMDVSNASIVDVVKAQNSATASAIAASSASKRVVARGALGGLPILGDELYIQFGQGDPGSYGATAVASRKVTSAPPVILGPGHSATMHLWFVANATTPLQYELETGWWER